MEQIATGVYQVSRGVNAFVIDGDQGVTLVDTGLPGRQGAIIEGLADIGRSTKDITVLHHSGRHPTPTSTHPTMTAPSSEGIVSPQHHRSSNGSP